MIIEFNLLSNTAMCVVACATDNQSLDAYINQRVGNYLYLEGYTDLSAISISNSFDIYDFNKGIIINNRSINFVINDNNIIGILIVGFVNNDYSSMYMAVESDILTEYYVNNIPFAIGYSNGYFVLVHNGLAINLDGYLISNITIPSIYNEMLIVANRPCNAVQSRSALFNKQLNVARRNNEINADNGKGLCWAACIAMKVDYQSTSINYLMTLAVYNHLKSAYNPSVYGFPVGNLVWYNRAYSYYQTGCTVYTRGLGAGEVSNYINQNKPIQISLSGDIGNHDVIISGCTIYSNHAIYTIIDPNPEAGNGTGKVYQDVSLQAMSDPDYFVYYGDHENYGDAYMFNDWYLSIC